MVETAGYVFDSWAGRYVLDEGGEGERSAVRYSDYAPASLAGMAGSDWKRYAEPAAGEWWRAAEAHRAKAAEAEDEDEARRAAQWRSYDSKCYCDYSNGSYYNYYMYYNNMYPPNAATPSPAPPCPPHRLRRYGAEEVFPATRADAFAAAYASYESQCQPPPKSVVYEQPPCVPCVPCVPPPPPLEYCHPHVVQQQVRVPLDSCDCGPRPVTTTTTTTTAMPQPGPARVRWSSSTGSPSGGSGDSRLFLWGELWQRHARGGLIDRDGFMRAALFVAPLSAPRAATGANDPSYLYSPHQRQFEAEHRAFHRYTAYGPTAATAAAAAARGATASSSSRRNGSSNSGDGLARAIEGVFYAHCKQGPGNRAGLMDAAEFLAACKALSSL